MSKTETQSVALMLADLLNYRRQFGYARIGDNCRFVEMDATLAASIESELRRLDAENKALRARLEIDPSHPIDGIAARDETIRQLEAQIKGLRADANRYRWLRANAAEFEICVTDATGVLCGNRRDADLEIDACIVAGAAAKTGDAA